MATYYVTNHGNDNNDGLSIKNSWRSLNRVEKVLSNSHTYYLDGTFYDFHRIGYTYYRILIGINNTKIDGKGYYNSPRKNVYLKYLEFFNFSCIFDYNTRPMYKCVFHDSYRFYRNASTTSSRIYYCLFYNINYITLGCYPNYNHNTFHNCKEVRISNYDKKDMIFSNCTIKFYGNLNVQNSLFINCSFMFMNGKIGHDENTYAYPIGDTNEEKIQSLKDRMSVVYGKDSSEMFKYSIIFDGNYNEIFVDADNGDFHLVPNCIATKMDRDGNYIGALKVKEPTNLDNFTLINVGTNGNIIDDNLDAKITSNIINLGKVRKITSFKNISKLFTENGTQLNLDTNFGGTVYSGTSGIIDQHKYMVFNDNIFLNSAYTPAYEPYETFNASATDIIVDDSGTSGDGLDFITYNNGYIKEVLYDNSFEKFIIKCSKSDSTLSDAVELLMYVEDEPLVNIDRFGKPIIGNADPLFNEETAVKLYTKYIQYIVEIKSNNIPSIYI